MIFLRIESLSKKKFPKKLLQRLKKDGMQIFLRKHGRDISKVYNSDNTQLKQANKGGHLAAGDSNNIYLDRATEADQQFFQTSAVHEIGHLTMRLIESHRKESRVVIGFHFRELKKGKTGFITSYSKTSYREWFAEAFSIYYAGKHKLDFTPGIYSYYKGSATGSAFLYNEFMKRDPIGFLMMAKLDYVLQNEAIENVQNVFRYKTRNSAIAFLEKHDGKLTEKLVQKWLKS